MVMLMTGNCHLRLCFFLQPNQASNHGFGCAAALGNTGYTHGMIACSLRVSCVPGLLRKNFRGLLLSPRGPIANLSRTCCFPSVRPSVHPSIHPSMHHHPCNSMHTPIDPPMHACMHAPRPPAPTQADCNVRPASVQDASFLCCTARLD